MILSSKTLLEFAQNILPAYTDVFLAAARDKKYYIFSPSTFFNDEKWYFVNGNDNSNQRTFHTRQDAIDFLIELLKEQFIQENKEQGYRIKQSSFRYEKHLDSWKWYCVDKNNNAQIFDTRQQATDYLIKMLKNKIEING